MQDWMNEYLCPLHDVSVRTGIDVVALQKLLMGQVSLDIDTASRLELLTQIPARFWINRERIYRDGLAKGKEDVSYAGE